MAQLSSVETGNKPRGARNGAKKIRVALIGIGNCASSIVQGVEFYRNARAGDQSSFTAWFPEDDHPARRFASADRRL